MYIASLYSVSLHSETNTSSTFLHCTGFTVPCKIHLTAGSTVGLGPTADLHLHRAVDQLSAASIQCRIIVTGGFRDRDRRHDARPQ